MNTDRNISPRSEVDVTNTDTHVTECLHHRINPVWLLHGQMYSHHGHIDIDIDYILYARYRYALYHHQDHQIKYERCSYLPQPTDRATDSRAPCAMPPPYPKRRQPTQSHRTRHRGRRADRQGRHPRTEGETPRATDAAGAGTGSEAESESVGGDAGRDRTGGATVGQAKTGRATRRPSEPETIENTGVSQPSEKKLLNLKKSC